MQMPMSFSSFMAQNNLTLLTFSATACNYLNVIWRNRKGHLNIS